MRLFPAATLAIATLALALAACGGDDGLSRAELARRADAICTDSNKKVAATPRPPTRSLESAAAYYAQTRPIISDGTAKLERLKPDDAVRKDWLAYVRKQAESARLLDDLVDQLTRRDPRVQQTRARIASVVADVSAAAQRVGADACASSSPAAG